MTVHQARTWVDTDGVWTIEVPSLTSPAPDGTSVPATGAATSWSGVESSARDLIAAWIDAEPGDVQVEVHVVVPDIVIELWHEGHDLEEQARRDLDRAARIRRHAASLARDAGYPSGATALALGISQQRVAQLAPGRRGRSGAGG
ncbi:hypothetical protein JS278_02715 [Acidipropionibacterium virtanenii]|uniref:Antitoxin HicB n=1 Tax=Acidipropionibacterium virtanenii TaxID=2057246 RepID=A0A344UX52_9ACTN|nr:hypothetical protein JS278_02715 [Acidipropionibacterium virtanenii]